MGGGLMPIKINGATSGSVTIKAPDTGTDQEVELIGALAAKTNVDSPQVTNSLTVTRSASDTWPTTATIRKDRAGGAVLNGDNVGSLIWRGMDSAGTYVATAQIQSFVDGEPDVAKVPGSLVFSTKPIGATNTAERMRIDNAGRVGIGTTNPTDAITIAGHISLTTGTTKTEGLSGDPKRNGLSWHSAVTEDVLSAVLTAESVDNYGADVVVYSRGSWGGNLSEKFRITANNGYLVALGVYNKAVGGTNRDVYVDNAGNIGYVSSLREQKTDIAPQADVSWLLDLEPVTFKYRAKDEDGNPTDESDGGVQYGLIAEDVEAVNPEVVFYDDTETGPELRGVSYSKLITPLLALVQQQQARINALEARLAVLEGGK